VGALLHDVGKATDVFEGRRIELVFDGHVGLAWRWGGDLQAVPVFE